jgi:hypothetical protein
MLIVCAACRSLPFPDPSLQGDYGAAVKKWTRTVTLYSGLETRAFVRVVYLSPEFVEAQAREISTMRAESPEQAAQTRARLRQQYAPPTFFAVVYMPDRNNSDWDQKDSIWRIAVNVGTGDLPPTKVERFDTPFNAEQRALYPYLDEYSVGYQLHVPAVDPAKADPPGNADLTIAGAPGIMRFHWRTGGFEPPSKSEPGPEEKRPESPKP